MYKKLFRSRKSKVIGGVAGGLAEYFDIDPIIVRVLFAVAIISGVSFILYIALWIFVPLDYRIYNDHQSSSPSYE